jgi:precorrin-6A/cobalt-precorrin-6A reductase
MPRINGAASARWRAPPKTTAADRINSRPAALNPSMPSSPIPTMDNHRRNAAGWGPASSASDMRKHILILGGTTEARECGQHLAARTDIAATLSLAGRTVSPLGQAIPVRRGGFGGIAGLAQYLRDNAIEALIDATHPYAPTISDHALHAASQTQTPIIALCRPPWRAVAGDRWAEVLDAAEAARTLGTPPRNVFLAVGRQEIAHFASAPQHRYLIRSVDPVEPPLAVPHARYILARGPFEQEQERALLLAHAIDVVVAKNSGGAATYGKIAAARTLGIPVMLLRRPPELPVQRVASVGAAIAWLDHVLKAPTDRGV